MSLSIKHINHLSLYAPGYLYIAIVASLIFSTQDLYGQQEQINFSNRPGESGAYFHMPADTGYINNLIRSGQALQQNHKDSAITLFQIAFNTSSATGYSHGMIESLTGLGAVTKDQGLNDEALHYYREAIIWCKSTGEENLLPGLYNALGNIYATQGKFTESMQFYYTGMRIAEQHVPPVNADYIYNNIAIALTQLGHAPGEIFIYLNKAEQMASREKNHALRAAVLLNKGIVYNTKKAWDSSRIYLHAALATGDTFNIPNIVHNALSNIGITYLEQNQPQKAMPYLLKADSMNALVDGYQQNIAFYTLGEAYFKQGAYKQAEYLLLEGLKRAREINQSLIIRELYLTLGKLYGALGQYEQAFRHLTSYIQINNSIAGENVVQHVNQLEVKYRTAQKDKEIAEKKLLLALQEKNIEQKNKWIAAISSGIVLLTLLLILLYRGYQHKKRSQAHQIEFLRQQRELLHKEQEIGQLKAMMKGEEQERIRIGRELHDGIGGLLSAAKINFSAIQRRNDQLAATEDFDNTLMLLDEATSELRKTAHNLMPEILIKSGLAEAITTFCERMQRGQELDIHVQCYGDLPRLDTSFELAVYRIIQELVHNIIKHARAQSALVQLNWQEDVFNIMVEDNGIGIQAAASEKPGIGLANIRSRVQALNGQVDIESSPGQGTTICITFARKELPGQHETTIHISENKPVTA